MFRRLQKINPVGPFIQSSIASCMCTSATPPLVVQSIPQGLHLGQLVMNGPKAKARNEEKPRRFHNRLLYYISIIYHTIQEAEGTDDESG